MKPAVGVVLTTVAIMVITIVAFTAGWLIGRTTALDSAKRIARIEQDRLGCGDAVVAPRKSTAPSGDSNPSGIYAVVTAGSPSRGPVEAPITIVEFMDFDCPYCARVNPTLQELARKYPGKIRTVFKHNPLPFHANAIYAHRAAVAAGEQGKFWEMHDLLFDSERKWTRGNLGQLANRLRLDVDRFDDAMDSEGVSKTIATDQEEARRLGVRGTPTFFVNGRLVRGAQPYGVFESIVDEILNGTH